jgi:hypothetical protein
MKKTTRLIALLLSLTFLSGCEVALIGAGAGVGVGTYRYIEGSVESLYPLSYNSAWDAANTALANLYISVSNSINEGIQGTIEAVRKDGTNVTIKLKDKGQNVTDISVRVGFWGNRKDAERIHEEIKAVAGLK